MSGHRIDRLTEDFKREMGAILPEVKDSRVKSDMISVLRVELTNDLSHAKIYISAVKGMWSARTAAEGLESASGFIKRALCSRLKMRKCPELHFVPDDSIEFSAKLEGIFRDLNKE